GVPTIPISTMPTAFTPSPCCGRPIASFTMSTTSRSPTGASSGAMPTAATAGRRMCCSTSRSAANGRRRPVTPPISRRGSRSNTFASGRNRYRAAPGRRGVDGSVAGGSLARRGDFDAALQAPRLSRELARGSARQEGVDAALLLDRAEGMRRKPQADGAAERVGEQRGGLQIGQEAPLRLVVGVAHIVADLHALAQDRAFSRHDATLERLSRAGRSAAAREPGFYSRSPARSSTGQRLSLAIGRSRRLILRAATLEPRRHEGTK